MAAIDTNVVIRVLVQDHAAQTAAALALIQRAADAGETIFVPVTVVLESEWVLRSRYKFAKEQVVEALSQLYSVDALSFEAEAAVGVALQLYSTCSADFADCLHIALTWDAGRQPFWTFDKQAAAVDGARLLEAA
jgi:predicted nucleic-acid-binding protein